MDKSQNGVRVPLTESIIVYIKKNGRTRSCVECAWKMQGCMKTRKSLIGDATRGSIYVPDNCPILDTKFVFR